jgi:hypothetical protein
LIYVSSTTRGTAGAVRFADEDILVYNNTSGTWAMFFDGSDVGVTKDLSAFTLEDSGAILMSFNAALNVPGVGTVDDSDIVRFVPTSTGGSTSGTFELYFDGSDVGLSTNREDIDALHLLPDGRLLLSTTGAYSVSGASGADEDLLIFDPSSLGDSTAGSWSLYFDGSDVNLGGNSTEDVFGVWFDNSTSFIYLSTRGPFSVSGLSGDGADIFVCNPSSTGSSTACTYEPDLYWDGSVHGFSGEVLDGFWIDN